MPLPRSSWLAGRLLAVVLAVACSIGGVGSAPLAAPVVRAQPADAPERLDPQRQASTVLQAFDLLMDRFVRPVGSAAVLSAGWRQLSQDAAEKHARPPAPLPVLTDNRASDAATFKVAFLGYAAQVPALPSGFVPAYSTIRGMVQFVEEGHTFFMDPQQYQEHLAWSRGDVQYGGIGARMKGPELVVTEVFEGSPAEQAGLRAGDVVLLVDGRQVSGLGVDEAVSLIRGPAGSRVELTVQRRGEPAPLTLSIQRAEIAYDFITHRLLDDGAAYVQLRGFPDPSVADELERSIATLVDQGAEGLILDLRGNPGGRIDVGSRLLSHFLPPGARLFEQVERSGRHAMPSRRNAVPYGLPLVVLVDSGTASMGEIFAAAVQDYGTGMVVGTTTSGSVAAAQVFPLDDGSALQVTVMEILSAKGRTLNGVGVTPDEVVDVDPADLVAGDDPVLDRAQAVLEAAMRPPLPVSWGQQVPVAA